MRFFPLTAILLISVAAGDTARAAPAAPTPAPVAEAAAPLAIASHRALYRMTLDSAANSSEVKGASGFMLFEWQDACDGWVVQQKLDVQFTHEEGEGLNMVSSYVTWEDKEGKNYTFNYRSTANGNPLEVFRGTAKLEARGGEGVANFTLPEVKEVKLPKGTMFPTTHTEALLRSAMDKKSMLTATVFDGTDAVGISEVSAVIGAPQPLKLELAKQGLSGTPQAWPLRMAFFDFKAQQAEPDYEMDTNMLANGVSEFMLLDYGKFRLRGTLEKLELLPKPGC